MDRERPMSAAFLDRTVGRSCRGSPTTTKWPPLLIICTMDMAAVTSLACPASSMIPSGMHCEALSFSSAAASCVAKIAPDLCTWSFPKFSRAGLSPCSGGSVLQARWQCPSGARCARSRSTFPRRARRTRPRGERASPTRRPLSLAAAKAMRG
eukprot:1755922-Pyramimonas_sp.AAC.1